MVKRVAPLSYEAWVDYDLESRPLTRAERDLLSRLVDASDDTVSARAGARVSKEDMKKAGLSPREVRELIEKLQAPERPDFDLDLARFRTAEDVAAEMYQAVPGDFQ
jgi:hypothetical protein